MKLVYTPKGSYLATEINCTCQYAVGKSNYSIDTTTDFLSASKTSNNPTVNFEKVVLVNKKDTVTTYCNQETETRTFKTPISVEVF